MSALAQAVDRRMLGRYEIVAFYKRLWDLDPDNHEVMKSDPAKFLVDGQGGEFYRLGFERPENAEEDARKPHMRSRGS